MRAALGCGELQIGTWVNLVRNPAILPLLKSVGLDFARADMEHTAASMETIANRALLSRALNLPIAVRPPRPIANGSPDCWIAACGTRTARRWRTRRTRPRSSPSRADTLVRTWCLTWAGWPCGAAPFIYCVEEAHAGGDVERLVIDRTADIRGCFIGDLLGGVSVLNVAAWTVAETGSDDLYRDIAPVQRRINARAVPYPHWAHRTAGSMAMWLHDNPTS